MSEGRDQTARSYPSYPMVSRDARFISSTNSRKRRARVGHDTHSNAPVVRQAPSYSGAPSPDAGESGGFPAQAPPSPSLPAFASAPKAAGSPSQDINARMLRTLGEMRICRVQSTDRCALGVGVVSRGAQYRRTHGFPWRGSPGTVFSST